MSAAGKLPPTGWRVDPHPPAHLAAAKIQSFLGPVGGVQLRVFYDSEGASADYGFRALHISVSKKNNGGGAPTEEQWKVVHAAFVPPGAKLVKAMHTANALHHVYSLVEGG